MHEVAVIGGGPCATTLATLLADKGIDVVMFTGRTTLSYMKEEHPLEYQRLLSESKFENILAPAPSPLMYRWSVVLGLMGLSVGITLIGLIIWALFQWSP